MHRVCTGRREHVDYIDGLCTIDHLHCARLIMLHPEHLLAKRVNRDVRIVGMFA